MNIRKTSRGFLKLSFRVGTVYENDKEIQQNMKFICSKVHISGSLKKIQKEYNIQPQLIKSEIAHNLLTLSNYKEHEKNKEIISNRRCIRTSSSSKTW